MCSPREPCARTAFSSLLAWVGLATERRSMVSATAEAFHWIWSSGLVGSSRSSTA
jgi:hypothetical protein